MRRETPKSRLCDIARSLDEGWHYLPDWRSKVVEQYLVDGRERDPLQDEQDCFVRQFYSLRRTGACLEQSAFEWAYACHAHNAKTGAGSLLKSLTLASVPAGEIAEKLLTQRKNIIVFQRLFFDVEKCLSAKSWLTSLILSPMTDPNDPVELRERRLLTAALLRGQRGVGQAYTPSVELTPEERDLRLSEIKSALTVRVHEYVLMLQSQLIPPAEADFRNLLRLLDVTARQPLKDDYAKRLDYFVNALNGELEKLAEQPEYADDPLLSIYREPKLLQDVEAPQKVLTW